MDYYNPKAKNIQEQKIDINKFKEKVKYDLIKNIPTILSTRMSETIYSIFQEKGLLPELNKKDLVRVQLFPMSNSLSISFLKEDLDSTFKTKRIIVDKEKNEYSFPLDQNNKLMLLLDTYIDQMKGRLKCINGDVNQNHVLMENITKVVENFESRYSSYDIDF